MRISDIVCIVGVSLFLGGVWSIYWPAALMVAGGGLVMMGAFIERQRRNGGPGKDAG